VTWNASDISSSIMKTNNATLSTKQQVQLQNFAQGTSIWIETFTLLVFYTT
jgi:hypothetical protein